MSAVYCYGYIPIFLCIYIQINKYINNFLNFHARENEGFSLKTTNTIDTFAFFSFLCLFSSTRKMMKKRKRKTAI